MAALAAYLLGSIPTGYLAGKAKRLDIRASGSGNIGATNALRVLGKPAGICVLLADCAKGFAAVKLAPLYLKIAGAPSLDEHIIAVVAGIFAVLGHNYTCWLRFKGGKGIATTAGVYLALAPAALGAALAVFFAVVALTRYVSLGSMAGAVALPVAVWFTQSSPLLRYVTIALAIMALYKHRGNLRRLLNGTESRVGQKSTEAAQ
ncbi:MAG: glycerol-3-phosphate 1-O-acyltransferase PlsY [Verrucomicrobia bacterium]|nr:glycerol-3-phosphate 1-O-acyltransferase PlsY [Verrucomicrobiota bacterium]MDE3099444.1 glycerol-3-phosphate 1-O-acyltransferase PlsY [Verrucomicrobiota bacterium]